MSQMKASRMIRLTLVSTSVAAALMLAGCSVIAPEKLFRATILCVLPMSTSS